MTLFRVDFGSSIGLGHLMRSLVYAKNFDEVVYMSKSHKEDFVKPHTLVTIKNEEDFFLQVEKLQPHQAIVDNYAFSLENEKEFKKRFPYIKLAVFDDEYKEHYCDEIINHNISADIKKYKNQELVKIIPPLIRDEFKKEKNIKREKIYDVFIAIGGTDTSNLNIPILKALPKSLHVAVVTTTTNSNLSELKEYVKKRKNTTLHVNSNEVAKLMHQSRFAIVTPSVIVHEVLFMGLDFLAIKTADNQDDIYKYLKQRNYKIFESFEKWYNSNKKGIKW